MEPHIAGGQTGLNSSIGIARNSLQLLTVWGVCNASNCMAITFRMLNFVNIAADYHDD
jgi:hypothetical protein